MTKYNTLNLHSYIFTAVQNSQYFIKSKDFHLGLRILRSKAPFGPEQSEMIYWNWFKMSAEGTRTICVFYMCRSCCILSAQQPDRDLPRTGFGGDSSLIFSCKEQKYQKVGQLDCSHFYYYC